MKFEIINPSDACTMEADSYEVAAVCGCVLGVGAYGLQEIGGAWSMPVFIFSDPDEWFTRQFGSDFNTIAGRVSLDPAAIACFESVALEGERTSLNDIVRRAKASAEMLREKVARETTAP